MLQNIFFPIDHHCKTQSELADMLKNSPNLLNFLQGVVGYSGRNFHQLQNGTINFVDTFSLSEREKRIIMKMCSNKHCIEINKCAHSFDLRMCEFISY